MRDIEDRDIIRRTFGGGLRRDFIFGSAMALLVGLTLGVYACGERAVAGSSWLALAAAVAGVALAEWAKFGLTGRHLSLAEALQDGIATGLAAYSASSRVLLQPPAAWGDMVLFCATVSAIVIAIYHAINLHCLASSGRHLGRMGGAMIFLPPYLINVLLLLESSALTRTLGLDFMANLSEPWPTAIEYFGRILAMFLFNEAVVLGLASIRRRKMWKSISMHLVLLAVAAVAVAGPPVAQFGSGGTVAAWPSVARTIAIFAAVVLSQAGLWAEVYLITGAIFDVLRVKATEAASAGTASLTGMKKGMIYSGVFIAILLGIDWFGKIAALDFLLSRYPLVLAGLLGAAAFPAIKTVIDTFDGSTAFFRRIGHSYRNPLLYLRGVVVGAGMGYAAVRAMEGNSILARSSFGLAVGVAAFAGISILKDGVETIRRRGQFRWRVYLMEAVWGGLIGAAIGFYLDATQVSIVIDKFHRYLSVGQTAEPFGVYPFLSKWGFIRLGDVSGGAALLYNEALAGVICWSIPAWLFALNRTFLAAYFRRDTSPILALFTRGGLIELSENMLEVLRWGLWMSPIINSFLRPMSEPTWYNQDGAIHTVVAIFRNATTSPEAFRDWSLHVFVLLLAYDAVRVFIWLDHMGLRVATLVNLSFLGMDRLETRVARFLGMPSAARCIPESVKRFATWAPLLIPYYIPRGSDWNYAWSRSEAIQRAAENNGPIAWLSDLSFAGHVSLAAGAVLGCTAISSVLRWTRNRTLKRSRSAMHLQNANYSLTWKSTGEIIGQSLDRGYDLGRRSYDDLHPAGRALFIVDREKNAEDDARYWPVVGNFPPRYGPSSQVELLEDKFSIRQTNHGIETAVEIALPEEGDAVELWTISITNRLSAERKLKIVPYLEWALNRPDADRGHTQYNRLFAEVEYLADARAVMARDKHSGAVGILAADLPPEGFLDSRIDFLGRARSLWKSRALEMLAFSPATDVQPHPTFDPLGSLLLDASLNAGQTARIRLMMGMPENERRAFELIAKYFSRSCERKNVSSIGEKPRRPIRHGEIPPGAPRPYWQYSDDGQKLTVLTPFTPRPFDHTLSNAAGHTVVVTNRGLHASANGNSQQNALTPNWPDAATCEVPGEAIYLYDIDRREWYSPTFHPLNDAMASCEAEFGVDGTAIFRAKKDGLATELTVFVPPDEPLGVYLLTIENHGGVRRKMRIAPYFQMLLADRPEYSVELCADFDKYLSAIYFVNPRNVYRSGPAFVAMSQPAERTVTERGRFFGPAKDVGHPHFVERGKPAAGTGEDVHPVAAMLATLEIPAGEKRTIAVLLGQADDRQAAEFLIRKYKNVEEIQARLAKTRKLWLSRVEAVSVNSDIPAFDRYLHWLKYQTLAERLWARRGFYQTSGAYGFRDQLQDAVNLMWMDPQLARRQILLHASQQFSEGDVLQWFHVLQDGQTGFAARNYASDPHLWLAWAAAEYVEATGDESILDERTSYVEAPRPLEPLPEGRHGMAFVPTRSPQTDTVYRHCMKAIDLVLDHRMGKHGLPLMCAGDWNDGLDEIGSQGRGESEWLGFFLHYILRRMDGIIDKREGTARSEYYAGRANALKESLETLWRGDRYLRAIHDDGTEIGVRGSGVWETDALTAAWAVIADMDASRARKAFDAALEILERDNVILLGWPALREDTRPRLGRSSRYPEGVRENGMYCHGVQWLVGAARILAERCRREGNDDDARKYREACYRLWMKISPLTHTTPEEIEIYGGQPNKQAADILTVFDPGRMIWNGYTGAAGWMFRQALEGVLGVRLKRNAIVYPSDISEPRGELSFFGVHRTLRSESSEDDKAPTETAAGDFCDHRPHRTPSGIRQRRPQGASSEKG